MKARFYELYPTPWRVSFYFRSDKGEMLHGGGWEYMVATPEEATAAFLLDFAKEHPGYKSENLELHEPAREYDMDNVFDYAEMLEAEHDRLQRVVEAARVLAVHIPAMLSGSAELENDERLALEALVAALAAAGE